MLKISVLLVHIAAGGLGELGHDVKRLKINEPNRKRQSRRLRLPRHVEEYREIFRATAIEYGWRKREEAIFRHLVAVESRFARGPAILIEGK